MLRTKRSFARGHTRVGQHASRVRVVKLDEVKLNVLARGDVPKPREYRSPTHSAARWSAISKPCGILTRNLRVLGCSAARRCPNQPKSATDRRDLAPLMLFERGDGLVDVFLFMNDSRAGEGCCSSTVDMLTPQARPS